MHLEKSKNVLNETELLALLSIFLSATEVCGVKQTAMENEAEFTVFVPSVHSKNADVGITLGDE